MKQFYGKRNEILLNTSFDMDRVVVFVPGMSGRAHSGRFAWIDEVADEAGYASARVDLWADADELQTLTWNQVQSRLADVLQLLESQGYVEVVLVGKSFGGAVSLMYQHPLITKKILWSPAITVAESSNFASLADTTLGTIEKLTDISVSAAELSAVDTPIYIIHGDADEVVGVDNSKRIVDSVTNGQLTIVPGGDHSFKATEAELIAATKAYLG